MLAILRWIETLPDFIVGNGGTHQWIVKHDSWVRPFPISFRNNRVNKLYIKSLMKLVVGTGLCTKEDFDAHL